ncbi:hypothetical protein CQA49_00840 [Helicobacter sp. MIT 00-7814]|uniref:hypothetical protein n=1 Tax=unclassified Helicobacter TaxID=2593540 RepID=UPI000E1F6DB9|nr:MULTISPECIES: hypothetical protein [unclassified Helicobacter]RDU55059.1 hypothetical protein CQA37_04430 [Helicobacter sp. MIT 99-10781]RDU56878.1 hypothetical protein CQA49_00840 [Helicobacter sp. MIT 00-7814]
MRLWNKAVLATILLAIALSGCSIGRSKSFCESEGCNYKEAGVCGSAYDIFADRSGSIDRAYKGIACKNK